MYYGVVGLGVYDDWEKCIQMVRGVRGARFRKFAHHHDALYFSQTGELWKFFADGRTVFTDGSCKPYGKGGVDSVGGVGIFFGHEDGRNTSEPFPPSLAPCTNQRAEIYGVIRGLELAGGGDCLVVTDSKYVVDAVNMWLVGWKKRKWANVKNSDLFTMLDRVIRERKCVTGVEHVRGHASVAGNVEADRLANEGTASCASLLEK
jgi:ribonuclease HI